MFRINTQNHVKIWFHLDKNDPHAFINLQNRQRLEKLRKDNPDAQIHFIYSDRLLSDLAKQNLFNFCRRYQIQPLSLEKDIAERIDNSLDKALLALALAELTAAMDDQGGNLAVVSDMVRWLTPVFELGIYSDLDVQIKTKHLAKEIIVNGPIISNFGSVKIPGNYQELTVNNDVLCIPNIANDLQTKEKEMARKMQSKAIDKVKNFILKSYTDTRAHFQNIMENIVQEMNSIIGNEEVTLSLLCKSLDFQIWNIFQSEEYGNTPLAIRKTLDNIYSSIPKYIAKQIDSIPERFVDFVSRYRLTPSKAAEIPNCYPLLTDFFFKVMAKNLIAEAEKKGCEPEALITKIMAAEHNSFYKNSVINTTGPTSLFSIFGKKILPDEKVKAEVLPCALSTYGLEKHFISKYKPQFSLAEELFVPFEKGSDLSWTKLGRELVAKRESEIREKAAEKIQAHWRLFKVKRSEVQHEERNLNPTITQLKH